MSSSHSHTIPALPTDSQPSTDDIRIAVVDSEDARAALFRFRYDIYVREMHRPQKHADHARGRIEDPLDANAINLVAWQGDRIVRCVRMSFADDGGLEAYDTLHDMALHSPDYPVGVGIVTRLMLAKEVRGGDLATRMIRMACRMCLEQGVRHAYIDRNAHLTALFLRCGFVAHIGKREHPEYGLVQPMRLDLHDFPFYQIVYRNPISYLGYLYFLEHMPTRAGATYAAALLACGVPRNALGFLAEHTSVDVAHNALMRRYVEALVRTPADLADMTYAIRVTSVLYGNLLAGAVDATDRQEVPVPDHGELARMLADA